MAFVSNNVSDFSETKKRNVLHKDLIDDIESLKVKANFKFDFYIDLTAKVRKLSNNVALHVLADRYRSQYAYAALKRIIENAKK